MTRHEREQRRASAATARPGPPGLLEQAAADGKTVRGAVRADGSQVHLLSVLDVATGCVRAQREIDAKTNEIPELARRSRTWISSVPSSPWTRCTLRPKPPPPGRRQARTLPDDHQGQPAFPAAGRREGPGRRRFPGASWAEQDTGHGRRERRAIRTAPADGISWPHATQVMRIRRDSGPTHGPWTHKEIAYGITSLPADLAGPATWASTPATTGP